MFEFGGKQLKRQKSEFVEVKTAQICSVKYLRGKKRKTQRAL